MPKSFVQAVFATSLHFVTLLCVLAMLSWPLPATHAQSQPVRVIAFGAHPDDCDLLFMHWVRARIGLHSLRTHGLFRSAGRPVPAHPNW